MSEEPTISFDSLTVGPIEIVYEPPFEGPYYGRYELLYADTQRMIGFENQEKFDGSICWSVLATGIVLAICFSL